ncbi:MAG TPA: prepilin peptidase [Deltaproteobacteria bacterium]|nr:prepilin peptidase [Deltaproteobacteria bacterium]
MALLVALAGLLVGSFLNVCIYRIPRGESVVWPSSRCPACSTPIRAWDNVPVLSYLVLGGRCRACGHPISVRYPLVELLSALLAVGMLYRFGPGPAFVIYYAWSCVLVVITFKDIDHRIIPDRFSLGGMAAGIALVPFMPISYTDALAGLALGGGLLIAVIYAYYLLTKREGMGGGDVKLLAMIGVYTGWKGVLFTIFAASLAGTAFGIPWALSRREGGSAMKAAVPFGPFLALGALVYVFFGDRIIEWYFGFLA